MDILTVAVVFLFIGLSLGDEPIVHLFARCPSSASNNPTLHLTADVPAYALARCRNGHMDLVETDEVNFLLPATFDQSHKGSRCQFYKKDGSNTYTVDVEVGWGEPNSQIIQQRKIHTISCAYDDHGSAVSESETIRDWFLNPWESQSLLGGNSSDTFVLKIIDVLGRPITTDHISIGRKVQLYAEDISEGSGDVGGFRALSCSAQNSQHRYYILRAGCGDGLVFPKSSGFQTIGNAVYSPYFDAFKFAGSDETIFFQCRFTECDGPCNGDSCSVISNPRLRAMESIAPLPSSIVYSDSQKYKAPPAKA